MANPERFLIWGAGGHARVVADLIRTLGHTVVGFIDADPSRLHQPVDVAGSVVCSEATFLEDFAVKERLPEGATALAVAIGDNAARLKAFEQVADIPTPSLHHPTAAISVSAEIGRGSVVLANAVVNAAARIADGTIINSAAVIEHDCTIERGVHISPGAVLAGAVQVGHGAWIGSGAVVIPGVRIGADAIVGAGAVVIRDVREGDIVVGNPAARISRPGKG